MNELNAEKIILKCTNCLKPLCEILKSNPKARKADGNKFLWKIKASCPDCKGHYSKTHEVEGLYHFGGYADYDPSDLEGCRFATSVVDVKENNGNVILEVKNVK